MVALQRRAAVGPRTAGGLAAGWPAFFVAFDVLQFEGRPLLDLPYVDRRSRLEGLYVEHALTSPWTLCPMTTDRTVAVVWFMSWTDDVPGLEGLVIKPLTSHYVPGRRGWSKLRRRDSTEMVIGAVTGTAARPNLLVLGRYDRSGRLRAVGRTSALRPEASRAVGALLAAAGPAHPWTGVPFAAGWGTRDVLDVTLVRPEVVAEVSADRAVDHGGVFRHPLRFGRIRFDMGAADVPWFGEGPAAPAA